MDYFHIRAKIFQVNVGKWMIVGCVGQFSEPIRMKLFSEGSNFIFGSKKAHFGSTMCFFGLLGHIRAKISKVKVGKWMIVGCVGQFFESIRMKLFSEGSNFIFGSKKAHFGSKMCFYLLFGYIRAKISKGILKAKSPNVPT